MSVQRAGPVFTGDANIIPKGDKQSCSICLAPGTLMHEVKHALRRYIKAYAKDSGWYLSDIRFEKSYLAFSIELSSAASSLSQKPSAKR